MKVAIIVIALITSIILLLMVYAILVYINDKVTNEEKDIAIKEMKVYGDLLLSFENTYNLLDAMIEQYVEEDMFFNPYNPDEYISDAKRNSIIKNVSTSMLTEMSPVLRSHLTAVFNAEQLDTIITKRVTRIVVTMVKKSNSTEVIKVTEPTPDLFSGNDNLHLL